MKLCAFAVLFGAASVASSNVKYVNPFIGTKFAEGAHDYGGMIPSTSVPFAMTRWTAMTQENVVGVCPYDYSQDQFHGFLGTHQPALWMGESGQVAVCPGVNGVKTGFDERALKFSHENEVSTPQYYRTLLTASDGSQITGELSSTSRASILRFTFEADDSPFVSVQATRSGINGAVFVDPERLEISGWNPERQDSNLGPFSAEHFKGYFVARFDQPFTAWGTARGSSKSVGGTTAEGDELSAFAEFSPGTKTVNCRVGVSYISIDQARQNLDSEIPDGTVLEDVSNKSEKLWADKLDLVEITNATDDELGIFYTGMFHALQYPNEMFENNASGSFYYSGYDDSVHKGVAYTGYSIWDTFRAEWAFLNLFAPERINGMIQSMLQVYQQGGRLPMWQNIVETNIMIGTHSSSLIAESLAKGFNNFDLNLAWEAIWKDAMVPPDNDLTTIYYDRQPHTPCEARAGLTIQKEVGWVPAIRTSEAGSRTLEYAYDDYTVGVAAMLTGHVEDAPFYFDRSKSYSNIFNNDTMFMEARYQDGSWCADPNTWTEATKWVYTFNVQHDFAGLRDLFYGPEALGKKLDEYYDGGHNDQTNEPSHATVFAYYFANEPSKAQRKIRELLRDNYFNDPVGLGGQEDCGQMSSWYLFNSLGFYPVNPASATYMIGSPIFDRVQIKFPGSDHVLTLSADGAAKRPFVGGVRVDNESLTSPVLTHELLKTARQISFDMHSDPQEWAKNTV